MQSLYNPKFGIDHVKVNCAINMIKGQFYKGSTVFERTWDIWSAVAQCLTRDREATGSSLTGVTVLCP